MTKDEALRLALEAMNLANSSHNTMLLSDPPQSAWRYHNVDMKLREAITAIKAALEANEFNPDWDTQAVLVEEIQRMAKRIEELETEQDCVGWFGYDTDLRLWFETNKGDDGAIPLYKARRNT